MFRTLLSVIIITLIASCSGKQHVDRSAYEEELNEREIKRVTDAELYEAALKVGEKVANLSQQKLSSNLMRAIKDQGIEEAIRFCNLNAYSLVDSLKKEYDAEIKRVSAKYRNPLDKPDSLESTILEAYQYNIDNNLELESNVQKTHNSDDFLFTKPITINNPMCLQCHGEPDKELSLKTQEVIKKLYPEDRATNYKMNQLRGMWSIKLSRKKLILNEF